MRCKCVIGAKGENVGVSLDIEVEMWPCLCKLEEEMWVCL